MVLGLPHVDRPQTTWGGRILTLHLNYVAGYTDPLLFLLERTQQLTPLTTRDKPFFFGRFWALASQNLIFIFDSFFGFESTLLARQLHQERTQMEAQ